MNREKAVRIVLGVVAVSLILLGVKFLSASSYASGASNSTIYLPIVMRPTGLVSLPIDGVPIIIDSPFIPGEFVASEPGDVNQIASAFSLHPFKNFSITSIPYGTSSPVEGLPNAAPGGSGTYRALLAEFRTQQGGTPLPAPTVSLFGQAIVGSYSIVDLITDGETLQPTLVAEWVVEAESHLWIVRITRDLSDGTNPTVFLNSLKDLVIESNGAQQSVERVTPNIDAVLSNENVQSSSALPVPPWWSGDCNIGNHPGSYRLGATYDGLVACGPLLTAKLVYFFPGARGQYEWQCAELAKRYLYLKYNIHPYQANGKDVVNNMPQSYIGSLFERVSNGTSNKSPGPGDVISLGPDTTAGHVIIVTSANVGANGNGTIEIIEQNWSASGRRTLPVKNWVVGGSMTVSNWLHALTPSSDITTRVSVASNGMQGSSDSWSPSISADGRFVAFVSLAANLVSGDTNGFRDIFVHDRQTGQTGRVSVASNGTQGNGDSLTPSISADGRFVAFFSDASNLVPGDTNNLHDIFVHDRQTGQTRRVSIASNGTQGNEDSSVSPSISADGRFVTFSSRATNLVNENISGCFVHDLQTGQTSIVSVASDGTPGSPGCWSPSISFDGRYVTFESGANNLVPGDTNGLPDIFVRDRQTGQTSRVSIASNGTQGNGASQSPVISADGHYVAFHSGASNLIPNDTPGLIDIFIHDRQTGQTNQVSVASNGTKGNGSSTYPSISGDGRYVTFMSQANNLVPNDTNLFIDVFVHDLQTGLTSRVSTHSNGAQGNGDSWEPSISISGRFVAFQSYASNLVSGDTNGALDVFVYDQGE